MPLENSVSVEAGSTRVDGYLTQFVAAEGDTLIINGISALVQRRDSTSQITLKRPWPGPPVVESTNWDLVKTGPSWSSTVQVNTKITQLIERLEAGGVLKPDRAGPLSERDQYNDQGEGFLFLRTDVNPFLMHVKTGPGPTDWSAGQRIQGDPAQSTIEAQQAAAAANQSYQGAMAWAESPGDITGNGKFSAKTHATNSGNSATAASQSAQRAADWAEKPVDQDVTTPGTRSAKHHATKADLARAAAELAASQAQQGVVPDNGVTIAKLAQDVDDLIAGKALADLSNTDAGPNRRLGSSQGYNVTDWNAVTKTGWYHGQDAANAPAAGHFLGRVIVHSADGAWQSQELEDLTSAIGSTVTYRRKKLGATAGWSVWERVLKGKGELDGIYAEKQVLSKTTIANGAAFADIVFPAG